MKYYCLAMFWGCTFILMLTGAFSKDMVAMYGRPSWDLQLLYAAIMTMGFLIAYAILSLKKDG